MQERATDNYYIRNVTTPIGSFILFHNKKIDSQANKKSIVSALTDFSWDTEASQLNNDSHNVVNIENVASKLKQAERFVDKEHQVILVGDATTTGSFYLGRGANTIPRK